QEMSSIAFDKILGGALNAVVSAQNNSSLTTVNFIKSVGFQNDENGNAVRPVYVDFKYPKEIAPYQPGTPEQCYCTIENGGRGFVESELNGGGYKVEGADGVVLNFVVDSEGTIAAAMVVSGSEKIDGDKQVKITAKGKGEGEADVEAKITIHKKKATAATPAVFQDMTLQVPLLTIVPIPFIRVASTDIELNVKINSIYNSEESSETTVNSKIDASASAKFLFFKANVNINASVAHQKKSSSSEEVKKEYSLNIKIHAVQDDVPVGMGRILDILEESIVPQIAKPVPQYAPPPVAA
ncbi:MAG: DUF2589 domain-containing protein, partial [Clostridia bacterium]|nr:DUF2589 domain-containing protein [Clostridia bacterium]